MHVRGCARFVRACACVCVCACAQLGWHVISHPWSQMLVSMKLDQYGQENNNRRCKMIYLHLPSSSFSNINTGETIKNEKLKWYYKVVDVTKGENGQG